MLRGGSRSTELPLASSLEQDPPCNCRACRSFQGWEHDPLRMLQSLLLTMAVHARGL